jgi:hypothetical protein
MLFFDKRRFGEPELDWKGDTPSLSKGVADYVWIRPLIMGDS